MVATAYVRADCANGLEHLLLVRSIKGQYLEILSTQTWEIGFREADDLRTLGRRLGQEPLDLI